MTPKFISFIRHVKKLVTYNFKCWHAVISSYMGIEPRNLYLHKYRDGKSNGNNI